MVVRLIVAFLLTSAVAATERLEEASYDEESDGGLTTKEADDPDAVPGSEPRVHVEIPRPTMAAVRVAKAPEIDGRLDDEVWRDAAAGGPLTQYLPQQGVPPTEDTVFRVVYDDDALYVAFRCYDREPDKIQARVMDRDGRLFQDDYVIVVIDPFLDRRNGYMLQVNPTGARRDSIITSNINFNDNWDGIWMAAARIDDEGWTAEIAIPFRTVGFKPDSDSWGFNVSRSIRRKSERARWSGARPEIRTYNVAEAGTLTGLAGIPPAVGLEVQPYALARYESERSPTSDDDIDTEVGFDVRYRITPNLTASLSYNTDFAETEVDARQVNLGRFPLFFPEKRSFFLEDSGIFQFGPLQQGLSSGRGSDLIPFFSRRIGLSDDGEVVPILGAAKVTGRVGDYNIGVLNAVLEDHDDLHEQNTFVARISRNVLEQSAVGFIATAGDPNSDEENLLFGPDFRYRTSSLFGDHILQANVYGLGTITEGEDSELQGAYGASISLPNDQYELEIEFLDIEEEFNPALGFAPRKGIRKYEGEAAWKPRPEALESVRQFHFGYETEFITNRSDHLETSEHEFTPFAIEFETSDELSFEIEEEFDAPDEDFEIQDVVIPADSYRWTEYSVEFDSSSKRLLRVVLDYQWGEFYDGKRESYEADLWFLPWKYFNMALGYELNRVRLPQGDFDARVASVQSQVNFSPDFTWFHLVQYDNETETVGYNSRVQWEFQPGAKLFLVLNQTYDRENEGVQLLDSEFTAKTGVTVRF